MNGDIGRNIPWSPEAPISLPLYWRYVHRLEILVIGHTDIVISASILFTRSGRVAVAVFPAIQRRSRCSVVLRGCVASSDNLRNVLVRIFNPALYGFSGHVQNEITGRSTGLRVWHWYSSAIAWNWTVFAAVRKNIAPLVVSVKQTHKSILSAWDGNTSVSSACFIKSSTFWLSYYTKPSLNIVLPLIRSARDSMDFSFRKRRSGGES